MEINEKGYTLSTANEIIAEWEKQLQKKFGSDFFIKPEGVIDNIAFSAAVSELLLQEQVAYLAKQFDPETADGFWQDALYERIGIKRLESARTVFTKKVKGIAGYSGAAKSITVRSSSTNEEFVNRSDYIIEEDGTAKIEFEAVISGIINVNAGETFTIVSAPNEITGISDEDAEQIAAGSERESDMDFRIRFRNSKSQNARATRNANIANLLPFVDDMSYLKIIDCKTDETISPGTLLIIAKHNTTDEEFAKAIFNTAVDGVAYSGDTTVIVQDSEGQDVPITWKKAQEVPVDISATIKVRTGYYQNTVIANVKDKILEYIEKRIYGLESKIYATEFIVPMLETDGVEAVTEVQVKRTSDSAFSDSLSLTREQFPAFAFERISLNV